MAVACKRTAANTLFVLLLLVALAPHTAGALSMPANVAKKNKILCVGIATLDTIATLDEYPSPDEKVRSKTLHNYGGGNAANTAVAISRLTNNPSFNHWGVDLLTAVGDDANGDLILKELDAESVGVQHVEKYHGDSPWSYVIVAKDSEGKDTRTIIHQPATRGLSIEHVSITTDVDLLSEYSAVHFDARHPEAAVYLAKKCVEMGIPYSVDVERPREGLKDLLQSATVVICNSKYCSLALGLDDSSNVYIDVDDDDDEGNMMLKRFQKVLDLQAPKAKIGVMTIGSSGSFLLQRGQICCSNNDDEQIILRGEGEGEDSLPNVIEKRGALWCEAISVREVVDTTGAGDSFQGGFLSALWGFCRKESNGATTSSSKDCYGDHDPLAFDREAVAHALRVGTRVATMKIRKTGAREGLPGEDHYIENEFQHMNT